MADDPRVPPDVLDAAMSTPAAQRLVAFMARARDEHPPSTYRWMRSDISSVIAEALVAWAEPTKGVEQRAFRRVVELPDRSI